MNNLWEKFSDFYGGPFLARDTFETFCSEVLNKHYPDKTVINQNNIESIQNRKLTVVYLSKFFTDGLNSSRKGQIRNAFNDYLELISNTPFRTYAWILSIPYVLTDDEMRWWIDWKNKNTIKSGINIQIFDGTYLIELSRKYDIYNKYLNFDLLNKKEEKVTEETSSTNQNNKETTQPEQLQNNEQEKKENVEVEVNIEQTTTKEQNADKPESQEKPIENKQQTTPIAESVENTNSFKTENFDKETETVLSGISFDSQEPVLAQKEDIYANIQAEYLKVTELYHTLKEDQKKKFDAKNQFKTWQKLYTEINLSEKEQKETIKLFHKAKSYQEVRKEYITAIYVYQLLQKREDYKDILKLKLNDINKSIKECEEKSYEILYEIQGDINLILGNKTIALDFFKKAFEINKNNKNSAVKYFTELGNVQIDDKPEIALQHFQKVKTFIKKDETLERKIKLAKHLNTAQNSSKIKKLFIAPWAYRLAYSIDKSEITKQKLDIAVKKSYYAYSAAFIVLIAFLFFFKIVALPKPDFPKQIETPKSKEKVYKPIEPYEIAIAEGDSIIKNMTMEKIHLIDTAIEAYIRAVNYNYGTKNDNSYAVQRYQNAKNIKTKYIASAQANILRDSAYFITMRRFSDGLQLVKYLFKPNEPKNGKYCFIDSNKNIIIPPMYDFDYNRMYSGQENFIKGKALVCLFTSTNDTIMFYINKNNRIIEWLN